MESLWEKCIQFHGHACPGLAIGYKAVEAARKELGLVYSQDEEWSVLRKLQGYLREKQGYREEFC